MYPVGFEQIRRPSRARKKDGTINSSANFKSLPPVLDVGCSEKRRFSDPGLNNESESTDESINSDSSCSFMNETWLLEQITELKSENKRLSTELESTKDELKTLKSEFQVLSNKVTCHEPFSLARKYVLR